MLGARRDSKPKLQGHLMFTIRERPSRVDCVGEPRQSSRGTREAGPGSHPSLGCGLLTLRCNPWGPSQELHRPVVAPFPCVLVPGCRGG